MMYGLSDVRSIDFSTQWYNTYVAMIPETIHWLSYGTTFENVKSPLLQVLNLKYVFSSSPDSPAGGTGADVVASTSVARVWRLRDVQPRSFLVSDALVARDDSAAVSALRAAPEAVYRRVVLSAPGPAHSVGASVHSTIGGESAIAAIRYGPSESVWQVHAPEAGYMVTTDAYYPGWRAYVDGVRTPIYRANIAFRAIEVPAGEHRVVYRYEPAWLPVALILELLSALVVASALAWSVNLSRDTKRATSGPG
jgi:hypothetical protein